MQNNATSNKKERINWTGVDDWPNVFRLIGSGSRSHFRQPKIFASIYIYCVAFPLYRAALLVA